MIVNKDNEINASKLDIDIKHKKAKTCLAIDMTIASESNVPIKEVEKQSKYKDVEIDFLKMWEIKDKYISSSGGDRWTHTKKGLLDNTNPVQVTYTKKLQNIVLLRNGSWDKHIEHIYAQMNQINRNTEVLKTAWSYLPRSSLFTLYKP